jgi:carbon monoxide dehydrogenase subunit G
MGILIENEFEVPAGIDRVWAYLLDVERIAPCMPGAELQSVEGDEYKGVVKVKVGPITAQYKGRASFVERDVPGLRAVLKAEGRETRGQGNASATITATLAPEDAGTKVLVVTDLTVTGKVAQFGRGVLADVAGNLIAQFAKRLEADVLGVSAGSAPIAEQQADIDSVDLLKVVAVPMAKRYAPVVAAVAAGAAVGFLLGRRKRAHPATQRIDDILAALSRLGS